MSALSRCEACALDRATATLSWPAKGVAFRVCAECFADACINVGLRHRAFRDIEALSTMKGVDYFLTQREEENSE